jgi:hypothetical protein
MPPLKDKLLLFAIKISVSGTLAWPYLRPWALSITAIPPGQKKQALLLPHLGLTQGSSGRKYIPNEANILRFFALLIPTEN